jgi:hypothetical protein
MSRVHVKEEIKLEVVSQLAAETYLYLMIYNSLFLLRYLLTHTQHIILDNENDPRLQYNTTDSSNLDPRILHMLEFHHHLHTIPL